MLTSREKSSLPECVSKYYILNLEQTSAVLLFVGRLTSQQHARVSQGQICSDNYMCCNTEKEVADQICDPPPQNES